MDTEKDLDTDTHLNAPPAPPKDPAQERLDANREKFRAAFIHNHGWDEGKLTDEQKREIENHPYWTDAVKLDQAVNPPAPEGQPTA